ncbi:MAG: hypothetical protein AAGA05_00160 [Pseudomonadota bacterium]
MTRALTLTCGLLLARAVAFGFRVAGGPGQARAEREDTTRLALLEAVSRHLDCPSGEAVFPSELTIGALNGYCSKSFNMSGYGADLARDWVHYSVDPDANGYALCVDLRRADVAALHGRHGISPGIEIDPETNRACDVAGSAARHES